MPPPDHAVPAARRPSLPATAVLVAVGGAGGGLLRHLLTMARPDDPAGFGWTVLAVNAVGSLLLGLLLAGVVPRGAPAWVQPLLGTGVLGGFTTFSAISQTVDRAASTGALGTAVTYLLVSVAVGVLFASVGVAAGNRLALRASEARQVVAG